MLKRSSGVLSSGLRGALDWSVCVCFVRSTDKQEKRLFGREKDRQTRLLPSPSQTVRTKCPFGRHSTEFISASGVECARARV